MSTLFDNTEKLVKFNRSLLQQLQVKSVLNPYTQAFIDVEDAKQLRIIVNDKYRNHNGDLISLSLAASEGLLEFTINNQIDCEEMEIEYRSRLYPIITSLSIHQVYDYANRRMITFREAIDNNYLDTDALTYSCSNIFMSIHEAFYCGLILGEMRTKLNQETTIENSIVFNGPANIQHDLLSSLLKTVVNSLMEFKNIININDQCQLTADGYIQHKATKQCYLLTQAIELGLVSISDDSPSTNHSTLINETNMPKSNFKNFEDDLYTRNILTIQSC